MAAQLILTLLLDGLMALLLVITTLYCWRLNKRIRVLQDSKSELAQIIRQFDESTQRATQSIAEIHGATSRIAENIQHKIDKANYLADDLQFMIEKGNKLADKMEGSLSGSRPARPQQAAAAPVVREAPRPAEEKIPAAAPVKRPEARIPAREPVAKEQPSVTGGDKARASLENMLRRVSGRNEKPEEAAAPAADARKRVPGARLRSRAEQELFDALKTGGNKS